MCDKKPSETYEEWRLLDSCHIPPSPVSSKDYVNDTSEEQVQSDLKDALNAVISKFQDKTRVSYKTLLLWSKEALENKDFGKK